MMLPLPDTISGSLDTPESISYLHNMYNVGGALVSREPMRLLVDDYTAAAGGGGLPSLTKIHNLSGRCRCLMVYGGNQILTVVGDAAYQYTTVTDLNPPNDTVYFLFKLAGGLTIPGDGDIAWAEGYTGVAFATGTKKYFIDSSQNISELTDADLPDCMDVVYLGGRYVWLTTDGESIFWSAVDDAGNVTALTFFDAEARPDKNRALAVIGEDLFVFGEESIQRFRNIGGASQPFINVSNSVIPIGYLGGMIKLSTKVLFLGRENGGAVSFYEMSGSSINKISPYVVDSLMVNQITLNGQSTLSDGVGTGGSSEASFFDVGVLRGQSFPVCGENVYTFTTDDFTLYAKQSGGGYQWGFLSSDINAEYSDNDEWHSRPMGKAYDSVSDAGFHPTFEFQFATFFDRRWIFAGNMRNDDSFLGIFEKTKPLSTQNFKDLSINTSTNASVERSITRGLYLGLNDAAQRDTVFDSLEVSYSRRARGDYMTAVTGDSADDLNMYLSLTGLIGTWSTAQTISYGDKDESERIRYNFSGGLTPTNGCLQLALETSAEIPFTITGLNANV